MSSSPREWWVSSTRENLLKGLYNSDGTPSTTNPPYLEDGTILRYLNCFPEALTSFDRLFGSMSAEEQARLVLIRNRVRHTFDNIILNDDLQNKHNRRGANYAGKYAGKR